MSKDKQSFNDLSALRDAFDLEPVESIAENQPKQREKGIYTYDQSIRIHRQRLKGNKEATIIKGIDATDEWMDNLATDLKKKCGSGGASKDGDIIIQGNHREKIQSLLNDMGFKDVKLAGG